MTTETKAKIKKVFGSFAERVLSTKLIFLALVWVTGTYYFDRGRMDATTWVNFSLGICAGVLGASLIDTKKPANPDFRILDDVNKGG